jgi:DNA-binding CsgD family transcriptional regulator
VEQSERLIDDFYAAAFLPERWPRALEGLTKLADGFATVMLAINGQEVRWLSSPAGRPVMEAFDKGGWNRHNQRASRNALRQHPGFLTDHDIFTEDEIATDPLYAGFLRPHGLGWCFGTTVVAPTGDTIVLNTEFPLAHGPVSRDLVAVVDPVRPHFARAALMSGRMGLERAQSVAQTLEAVGLPAAVLGNQGQVLGVNALFEGLGSRVVARAHGRIGLADRVAGALLNQALGQLRVDFEGMVRSIPVPASIDGPPLIVHLVPIRREAHDLFALAAGVLVVTPVIAGEVPSGRLLQGLFDLSPAEAAIAKALGEGLTIDDIASRTGKGRETIRHQLKAVFAKTGTSRQAELAALLAGKAMPPSQS